MDKRKGILNISTSIGSRILLLVIALYVRRLLIVCIGNEANGLNSLYTSIIGMLSVAELGVGSAIVFSMYRPIIDGDESKVSALYCLYRKLYRIIGAVIFASGLVMMPFLPNLINDYSILDIDVQITFFLTLLSVVVSYLYSAKTSLIEAHKKNYITISIVTISRMIRYGMQIVVLLIWKSYVMYLFCQIIETMLVWYLTEMAVRNLYPMLIRKSGEMDQETSREVSKNVKAMFMHKVGGILVTGVDSLIISAFLGVAVLGKFSNYIALAGAMEGIIILFFTPLTSVIGHLCASKEPGEIKRNFNHFYCLNYVLGIVFFLGFYAVIDDVVGLLFGKELEMLRTIVFAITLNQFVLYLRNAALLFRDASGTFYYDRWKPLAEGLANLILSILFVSFFPKEYGVAGVITATIITSLLVCHVIEPYILFKHVFKEPVCRFYLRNYSGIAIFAICLVAMDRLYVSCNGVIRELLINGLISLGISAAVLIILSLSDNNFGKECQLLLAQISEWSKK